jgi:hypothetical protein
MMALRALELQGPGGGAAASGSWVERFKNWKQN